MFGFDEYTKVLFSKLVLLQIKDYQTHEIVPTSI